MYLLILISTLALMTDMSKGYIPNELFAAGMMISQIWCISRHSLAGGIKSLLLALVVMALLFPMFAIGCLGAGDIKILMIFPGFCGFHNTLRILFTALVIASVLGVVKLIYHHEFRSRIMDIFQYIRAVLYKNRIDVYDRPSAEGNYKLNNNQIHFSLSLFISVMLMTQKVGII